jgi:putative Mn2+ efflux pump MntP
VPNRPLGDAGGRIEKLIVGVGASVGGSIGWWAGAAIGTMTAFMLCVVGTAVGTYAARRIVREYLP